MLHIFFTRVSPTHHQFRYTRDDGTGESKNIETKSFLIHDLTHFALESEAQIKNGFFGLLAQHYTLEQLAGICETHFPTQEALDVERVVGPLSYLLENEGEPHLLIDAMNNMFGAQKEALPQWLTKETIMATQERYRALKGQWNALPFGETLELSFCYP